MGRKVLSEYCVVEQRRLLRQVPVGVLHERGRRRLRRWSILPGVCWSHRTLPRLLLLGLELFPLGQVVPGHLVGLLVVRPVLLLLTLHLLLLLLLKLGLLLRIESAPVGGRVDVGRGRQSLRLTP